MYDMAEVMAQSGYTEEAVFDCGISGQIVFLVVVPEIGACRVPEKALSHFMAGAESFTAGGMPEHWTGQLSGSWEIKRDRLRILADSWESFSEECQRMAAAIDRVSINQPPVVAHDAQKFVDWYDQTLDAQHWLSIKRVSPREAAALLCQFNPHTDEGSAETCTNVETTPDDYKRLLRKFEDLALSVEIPRSLKDWMEVAREAGLRHHSWLGEYVRHMVDTTETLVADTIGNGKKADAPNAAVAERRAPDKLPLKRLALIQRVKPDWPSIETDVNNASRNGLKEIAHLGNGWSLELALQWADSKGKLPRKSTKLSRAGPFDGLG